MSSLPRVHPLTCVRLLAVLALLALSLVVAPDVNAVTRSDVIVILDEEAIPSTGPGSVRAGQFDAAVNAVLADVPAEGLLVRYRYRAVPAFAASASDEAIAQLSGDPRISKVMPDLVGQGADSESFALVHAGEAQALGYDGQGVIVGVIDSGVDFGHPDFAGAVVHEECFMANPGLTSRCPNGSTYQVGSGAAADDLGHGSNVAGIIAGRGVVAPIGIAPKASLSVYKVLDTSNHFYFSDLFAAVDDILVQQPQIDVLNMSLGTFGGYTPGMCTPDPFFDRLKNDGILAFASSMNEGYKNAIGYPACVASIVSVGAVYDETLSSFLAGICSDIPATVDTPACWSNSYAALDLLAPGCVITSAGLGGSSSAYCGTSQAAPHAAGAAALLVQQRYDATPDEIESRLKSTGVLRTDPANGVTTPRIDVQAAVSVASFGDVDCDFRVDGEDIAALLKHAAGIGAAGPGGCPPIGADVGGRLVGDVTCDGSVSASDALKELVYYARVPQPPGSPSCPAVGETPG